MTVSTSDFSAAAFAIAKNHNLVDARSSGRKVSFVFERTDRLVDDLNQFRCQNPPVRVHDYVSAQRRLKQVIFEETR